MPERATSAALPLSDGAVLGIARYGRPGGRPLLYFHGWPGSRLQGAMVDAAAREQGWDVVAVDRPGIGLSRCPEPFALGTWPERIRQLLDALGWERCHILAISGGAPSTLACAALLPERLRAVGIVCGAVPLAEAPTHEGLFPLFRLLLRVDRTVPRFSPAPLWLTGLYLRALPPRISTLPNLWLLRGADRRIFADSGMRKMMGAAMAETYRQGPMGSLADGRAIAAPWGFDWRRALGALPVRFWHGDRDRTIPLHLAQWAIAEMGRTEDLHVSPGEGHFSLPLGHPDRILRELGNLV